MKHIVLTGGGTAGHVTPNIALIPKLKEAGYKISYIGSYDGMERKLIEDLGIPYYGISSGKLRRYFDPKNFSDPFRVVKGYFEAKKLLKKLKPNVVFSKGGFVSVPVVLAAKACKVPALIHESDMTPGLANRIAMKKATRICCNFPETVKYLPKDKAVLTGSPIRQELLLGNKLAGLELCGFTTDKPIIMVVGGSTGAVHVNEAVRKILPELLKSFQVVHLCGKGKMDTSLNNLGGYIQFEYISEQMRDLFAISDIVEKYNGVTAKGLVESALDKVKIIEDLGYDNLVISIKSSDVLMCVKAHELIAEQTNYPLHVGITESGTIFSGSIKSSIGLGLILNQGIGDTIRVSLTDDPVREVEAAKLILRTLGLRKGGIEVVSCPTCGRTRIDLIGLASRVEELVKNYDLDIKIAVMGCVVNGPGEAKEADLGIAGGDGCGVLIKHGEVVKKCDEDKLLSVLKEELDNWQA